MFGAGRNLIASLDYKGKTYNYCVFYDSEFKNLNTQFIEGDYQASNITLLWASGWIRIPDLSKDPRQVVLDTITELNVFLKKQFGGIAPVTWEDQLEAFFRKIILFLEADIPQAKIS